MTVLRRAVLISALVAVPFATAHAASYFLDPTNGGATCSASGHTGCNSTACRSYGALTGVVTLGPGDVVNFCNGTYRETVTNNRSGTSGSPITFRRAPGATNATISALAPCSSWTAVGSGVYSCPYSLPSGVSFAAADGISSLFIDGAPLPEYQSANCPTTKTDLATFKTCANYPAATCTSDLNCTIYSNYGAPSCVARSWCWNDASQSPANTLYVRQADGSSPAGKAVEAGARHANLVTDNQSYIVLDGLTFFGAQADAVFDPAISAKSTVGLTIKNCTLTYNASMGILLTVSGSAPITLTGNTFLNNGQGVSFHDVGFSTNHGTMLLRYQGAGYEPVLNVSNNTLTNVGTHNWARGNGSGDCGGCCWTDRCWMSGLQIENAAGTITMNDNIMTNVHNGSTWKITPNKHINSGSEIARNVISDWPAVTGRGTFLRHHGLAVWCSTQNASCSDSGSPVACDDSGYTRCGAQPDVQLKIYKNKIKGGWNGMLLSLPNPQNRPYSALVYDNFIDGGDGIFGPGQAAVNIVNGSAGIKFYNNSVRNLRETPTGGAGLCIGCTPNSNDGSPGGSAGVDFQNNVFRFDGSKIKDLSASGDTWSTNICDAAVSGKCAIGANTLIFANEVAGDLHLTGNGNGAAVDKGATLAGFNDDIDGTTRPVGSAWDIGAYEWSSSGFVSPPTLLSVDPVP